MQLLSALTNAKPLTEVLFNVITGYKPQLAQKLYGSCRRAYRCLTRSKKDRSACTSSFLAMALLLSSRSWAPASQHLHRQSMHL